MAQTVFQRYEQKYMMTNRQYELLMDRLQGRTKADKYGSYTVSNLYYDTDNFDLIRASIEKPVYKEKLRLRSYEKADRDKPVFLELKKKFKGIVYKRRAILPYQEAKLFLDEGGRSAAQSQVLNEVQYFIKMYPVTEKFYICYERTALAGTGDAGLRITFDTGIRYRRSELRLDNGTWGSPILGEDKILMEIKTPGAIPLWLCAQLSDLGIFPSSFSKYGTCYRKSLLESKTEILEAVHSA